MSTMNPINTPKSKARLENEIEKCREEGSWLKVLVLASQLVQNTREKSLVQFLLGESKLELYLELCNVSPTSPTSTAAASSTATTAATASNATNATTTTPAASAASAAFNAQAILIMEQYEKEKKEKLVEESEEHLKTCLITSSSSPLCMDANLLLAKLYYIRQQFDNALKAIETSGIENVTQVEKTLPLRVMKLVTESFAIKGMALENLANQKNIDSNLSNNSSPSAYCSRRSSTESNQTTSKVDLPNNTIESRIFCLKRSSDLTLRYFQNVEKQHGQYLVSSVGGILESALQRIALLYVKNDQFNKAINQYRSMLNAQECKATANCRQIFARRLSEMIMRGITGCNWKMLDPSIQAITGAWKPHRYIGQSLFNPIQREEELLLLLQIAEQQAAANVILDRSSEFNQTRKESLDNVIAIYDLFVIAFTPFKLFPMDMFEKAMKFSFEVRHVWLQFALTLHHTNQAPARCSRLLQECVRLQPDDPLPLLFLSKLHLQHRADPEAALVFAEEALKVLQTVSANSGTSAITQPILSRCHLLVGVSSAILYEQQGELHKQNHKELLQKSISNFRQMAQFFPNDHLAHFHLALHLAKQQDIATAISHLQLALVLHPGHLPTIHLLLICLSALQRHKEAHILCESALAEFPGQLLLLFIKAHLETQLSEDGDQQALLTAKEMLRCCRKLTTNSTGSGNGIQNPMHNDPGSRALSTKESSYYLTGLNCDSLSLRLEQTLSEAACIDSSLPMIGGQLVNELSDTNITAMHHSQSSAALCSASLAGAASAIAMNTSNSFNIPSGGLLNGSSSNSQLDAMQMQVWLMVAELFIRLGQLNEAEQCLAEHVQTPLGCLSHQLLYVRARLHLARGQAIEAKILLQNAVSINPRHSLALQQLGLAYHLLGNHKIADKYLRDSLNCDCSCVATWSIMGNVLDSLGDHERAVNCHLTALKLEQTQPVLPFSIIPRVVLD